MIEPDLAEFVDDHGGIAHAAMSEQAVQQRGLPAAEKARDQRAADQLIRHRCAWIRIAHGGDPRTGLIPCKPGP